MSDDLFFACILGAGGADPEYNVIMPANFTVYGNALFGMTAYAYAIMQTDGTLKSSTQSGGGSRSHEGDTIDNKTGYDASLFEKRCTVLSGSVNGDSTGVWLSSDTEHKWWHQNAIGGTTTSAQVKIEKREKLDHSNIAEVTIMLQAQVQPDGEP